MNKRWYVLTALMLSTTMALGQAKSKPLFKGKSLGKWEVPADNQWWTVEAGVLKVKSDAEQQGSILWTKKDFKNFVLDLNFRFGDGTVDSGVFLREEALQIQIGISGSLKRDMTASPYVPGQGYPVEADGVAEILKPSGWNHLKIKTIDQATKVWLNGIEVMEYEADEHIEKGPIGLQLHANRDMSIDFKDIWIAKIK